MRKTLFTSLAVIAALIVWAPTIPLPVAHAANVFNTPDVQFMDDFLGTEFLQTESGSDGVWSTVETNLNAALAVVADAENGQLSMAMDSDSNAEVAALYWGDQRGIDLNQDALFEARVQVSVLPTDVGELVIGMAGDHNASADSITEGAWFKLDGSGAALMESDDTTNDNDDIATGITLGTSTWYTLRIDFSDISDVKFYIDSAQVSSGSTFDMSNLSSAEAIMQPYISMAKASGTGVGTVLVDYVRVISRRE